MQISKDKEADKRPIGKYGQMYLNYLKDEHPEKYAELRMSGELMPLIYKVNDETHEQIKNLSCKLMKQYPKYKTTLNNDAKMLYVILLDRMELSRTNGWVEDDGTIYIIFIGEKRQGLTKPNLIYIGKIDCSISENPQNNTPNSNDENSKTNQDNTQIITQTDRKPLKLKAQIISSLKGNNTDYNKTEINNIKLTKEIKTESNNYIDIDTC